MCLCVCVCVCVCCIAYTGTNTRGFGPFIRRLDLRIYADKKMTCLYARKRYALMKEKSFVNPHNWDNSVLSQNKILDDKGRARQKLLDV